jgi:hypothetical protein
VVVVVVVLVWIDGWMGLFQREEGFRKNQGILRSDCYLATYLSIEESICQNRCEAMR